jgi:hypothetical protein
MFSSSQAVLSRSTLRGGAATLFQVNDNMVPSKNNLPLLKLFNVQRLKLSWQRQNRCHNGVAG